MSDTKKILNYFEKQQGALLEVLREVVELESPTHESKEASDKCSQYLQDLFKEMGFSVQVIPQTKCGDHFIAELGAGEKGTMIVGHYDTVYPLGTLQEMPFKIEGDKAYGPGILDMKGGIILGCFAVKALQELELLPETMITFFVNGDEESGSFLSSDLIMAEALKNKNVLVLEPAAGGKLRTGRYGRGTYTITAHGRSAHSGSYPHLAISPMLELAHQIIKIDEMNDYEKGFTLAPTCMSAGIVGTCRIPETAWLSMDVRFRTAELAKEKNLEILNMQPITPGIRLEVTGEIDKPPLIGDPTIFNKAKTLGDEIGIEIQGVTVGGGSDGNFTSAAGVPTLDGLGMNGQDLHNPGEHIKVDDIPQRATLLARLLQIL